MVLRVVSGIGSGPTALAAYDAALLAAGVGNYNLIELSSVIPAGATLERPGTAPDLGPVGAGLHVVEASATAEPGEVAAAAVGWARRDDGSGLFYEEGRAVSADADVPVVASADSVGGTPAGTARAAAPAATGTGTDDRTAHERAVAERVRTGLGAGVATRGWDASEPTVVTAGADALADPADGGDDAGGDDTDGDATYASAVVLATYGRATPLDGERAADERS